jgi:aminopeptidase N
MQTIKNLLMTLIVLVPLSGWCADLQYKLAVDIDPTSQVISGTARLTSQRDLDLTVSIQNLRDVGLEPGFVVTRSEENLGFKLYKGVETQITFRVFAKDVSGSYMDAEHVFLTGHWYPLPASPAEYHLTVRLPKKFIAVSEADVVHREPTDTHINHGFQFRHPLDALHLAASSRFVVNRDYFQGIEIETCFFEEDADLADTYIQHAIGYLRRYEERLTFYPYRRLAIVENILPTGISLPTFTLLGKDVLRLPFIPKTSLGHEILHQWFGSGVYIDSTHGNWAEGLTTYLADHESAVRDGRDRAYRKQIMVDYAAYITPENVVPLNAFQYRSNKSESVIGYGKAAMFFHDLKNRLGRDRFNQALKDFIHRHLFQKASWQDLQRSFENTAGRSLSPIFDAWLNRTDIPILDAKNTRLTVNRGTLDLSFELQRESTPIPLSIPVSLYTNEIPTSKHIHENTIETEIHFPLDSLPAKVIMDENYDIMRHLTEAEIPPVLAAIFGYPSLTAIIPENQRFIYKPLLDALQISDLTITGPDEFNLVDVHSANLLIVGFASGLAEMLLGKMSPPAAGIRLRVFKNPLNTTHRILLADIENRAEAEAIQRKLRHYGQYSDIAFNRGRNVRKEIIETPNGIHLFEGESPMVVQPDQIPTLDGILPDVLDKRVIYIGEQHNLFSHHINQLHVIQQLHQSGLEFGLGLEMFKQPHQSIIDAYLDGTIDERTFLKQTHYFEEWGYDYNLYKPIVDYLKNNNIPLIALNLEEKITRQVARSGIDSLSPADKNKIPEDLDFSNHRYLKYLKDVYAAHEGQDALDDFHHFHQAQVLWDEAMAEAAYLFLLNNPQKKLIILAGNGHLRHRYGIPERLQRRTQISDVVLLQDESFEKGIADYVLQTRRIEGTRSPRLGVAVEETRTGLVIKRVTARGPAQKAGLAKGDTITHFNSHQIKSLSDLRWGLYTTRVGNIYPIQVQRNDTHIEMEIQLFDFSHLSMKMP